MTAIRTARPDEIDALGRMRCDLWPRGSQAEHRRELQDVFAGRLRESLQILVVKAAHQLRGFRKQL